METKEMANKPMLLSLFFIALIASNVYASLIPNVYATEITAQDRALAVLNNVVGLNITAYESHLNSQLDNKFWSFPQKEAEISFTSSQSKLRARCSFVNNNLRRIYISELNGAPYLKQAETNTLEMATNFLQRYRKYTTVSFYSELESMLGDVNINENSTKTQGNIKLEVSVHDQARVNFIWTYTDEHGVTAPLKNVVLSYEHGMLKSFLDNWHLYKIAGKPVLSREEAIETALVAFENFSYEIDVDNGAGTQTISKFKIESIGDPTIYYLNYEDESSARSADTFTLYPSWNVPLGFDKVYPGGVTGVMLRIWADTGEVSSMKPMVSSGASPTTNEETLSPNLNQSPAFLLILLATAVLVGATLFFVGRRKTGCLRLKMNGKLGFSRVLGSLLCLLLSFSIILIAIPEVKAVSPHGKATLDASMWQQLAQEKQAATNLLDYIDDLFYDNGYSVTNARVNYYTTSTTVSNVLGNISSAEQNYYRVAMFHFGHMAGPRTGYYDSYGSVINNNAVYERTVLGKHFFVWLWACWQAEFPYMDMPRSWTHRTNLAIDGYSTPDSGPHCFLGFNGSAPGISNATGSFEGYTTPAHYFIWKFYYYALAEHYSVKDALNSASGDFFNLDYHLSPLYKGFRTWWPYDDIPEPGSKGWHNGIMRVYGNGNIKLSQPQLTMSARDNYNNPLHPTFYVDDYGFQTGSVRVAPGTHLFDVSDVSIYYTFDHFHFDYGSSSHSVYYKPVYQSIPSDCVLTVYYNKIGSPPPQHDLTMLAINQYGVPGYVPLYIDGQYVGTTGYPYTVTEGDHQIYVPGALYNGHYSVFACYYIEGDYVYDNPMTLSVTEDKTVYACYWTYW
jgi:hypothetical protein